MRAYWQRLRTADTLAETQRLRDPKSKVFRDVRAAIDDPDPRAARQRITVYTLLTRRYRFAGVSSSLDADRSSAACVRLVPRNRDAEAQPAKAEVRVGFTDAAGWRITGENWPGQPGDDTPCAWEERPPQPSVAGQ